MKKFIPHIIVAVALAYTLMHARAPKQPENFELNEFGRLPALLNGRIQPIDTVARNTLIQIAGMSKIPESKTPALTWMMELITDPENANTRNIFRLHHPEIIKDLSLSDKGYRKKQLYWFSYNDLEPHREMFRNEAIRIFDIKQENRNHQERQIFEVANALNTYQRLRWSFLPQGMTNLTTGLNDLSEAVTAARSEAARQPQGEESNQEAMNRFMALGNAVEQASQLSLPSIIPPADGQPAEAWSNVGQTIIQSLESTDPTTGKITYPESLNQYANAISAFQQGDSEDFNTAVSALNDRMVNLERPHKAGKNEWLFSKAISATFGKVVNFMQKPSRKAKVEFFYNHLNPFACASGIYMLGFLAALVYVIRPKERTAWQTAYSLTFLAFIVHTLGIVVRMLLEGRPPVTNLYSSAVFVGWGAILLALFTEVLFRNALSILGCTMIGFATLRVAYYLSLDGDTMAMLQAVLDTNAWLATHVTTVTLGYSATFVAGFLGLVYLIMGIFTPLMDKDRRKMLSKVIYGIICFATLFSFVGTILGGIWADQSWGRFWGWDPKENGALLIVIFNAIILHARWGGMIRERGLVTMAIFGNVITAFSWFGTNLLGVGLHSYGFMEGTFKPLFLFVASQVLLTAIGMFLPERFWMSYRKAPGTGSDDNTPSASATA